MTTRVPELDRLVLMEESCKVSLLACISRTVARCKEREWRMWIRTLLCRQESGPSRPYRGLFRSPGGVGEEM